MQRNTWHDLETRSPVPIKDGAHRYAEKAEVMLWAFADGDGPISVWDVDNCELWSQDEISEVWTSRDVSLPHDTFPPGMLRDKILNDPQALMWWQNGGMFDLPVLQHAMPDVYARMPLARQRDTMVQAFAHGLPGGLDKLGTVLNLHEDHRKVKRGRELIRLFCIPIKDSEPPKYNDKRSHPTEWVEFIVYAAGDIVTMREAHRKMPKWNVFGPSLTAQRETALWHLDLQINYRGVQMDLDLAKHAVRAVDTEKARLAKRTAEMTLDAVPSTTQRDVLLAYLLEEHGITLPDMQSDTIERRLRDPEIPDAVRELLAIRLSASQNSVSKYKTLMKSVSADGRLRGTKQYCGAGRTGRWAGRLMQLDNMPRPTLPADLIESYILAMKLQAEDIVCDDIIKAASNAIRGTIVAPPGKKLVVADLSNIEGRMAAWLAGEAWKLQAFRDFDEGTGHDLYILSYAKSFAEDPATIGKGPKRQIGKVQELMFQYGGGVGAWITGAATYGIDLDAMTDSVWDTLPEDVLAESASFLKWLYDGPMAAHDKRLAAKKLLPGAPDPALEADMLKVRLGLPEKTWMACETIKRLWRRAHPMISSYWKELENAVVAAIQTPGVTYKARMLKVRRDGAWLRIVLPSGRALCYPDPQVDDDGKITYLGMDTYSKKWGRVKTYGGKLFENVTQAAARDQLADGLTESSGKGYACVIHVHDEIVCEVPDTDEFSHEGLAEMMCLSTAWNAGLPLAAAGFSCSRYRKE